MIRIENILIKDVRGVRDLTLNLDSQNYVIYGPNGSGKSGIVDAIEFALTGEISRLSGPGTSGLSILSHGPHVDKRNNPDTSFVELKLDIPKLGKNVKIKRFIKNPKHQVVTPDDDDVKQVLAEVRDHPEITLSRREIIRFILTEATKRSKDVQTLLKLDDIDQTRATFMTVQNRLGSANTTKKNELDTAADALKRHLELENLSYEGILIVVNKHRSILGLPAIEKLDDHTSLDLGVASSGHKVKSQLNKKSALIDVNTLTDKLGSLSKLCNQEVSSILNDLQTLEDDPSLAIALKHNDFVQTGLDLIDGPNCPLCDKEWDIEHLKQHLQAKLIKSSAASEIHARLIENGQEIESNAIRIKGLAVAVQDIAKTLENTELEEVLKTWSAVLDSKATNAITVDGLVKIKTALSSGWVGTPDGLFDKLASLKETIETLPEESSAVVAQTFLTLALDRYDSFRTARQKAKSAEKAWNAAKTSYEAYCDISEAALTTLYEHVEGELSQLYQEMNQVDEAGFTAKLEPSRGKLELSVDFYGRGLFPPGAYHSEGHQDGMGVCLYLALMKRLFGDQFTLAVLDDVVMSVDSQHRKEFCKLLIHHFPETQFIITTHDQLWAQQMRTSGVVDRKHSLEFYGWTIDTGPIVSPVSDVWDEIDKDLSKNQVPDAAGKLRRHLEFVSRELAGELVAYPPFRPDGNYDLGDLLPSVVGRHKTLLGKAADTAQSWGNEEIKEKAIEKKDALKEFVTRSECEKWAINNAVHYNAWANFSRNDFQPVVSAYKSLLEEFRCEECDSWLYVSPKKGIPESLRCACFSINFNLKPK